MAGDDELTRRAAPGELCTCGRPARVVHQGGRFGDTGDCAVDDGGLPVDGVCTFCGDAVDHDHYGRAEAAAGRPGTAFRGEGRQGGRCPMYRLRLAEPLPALHPESVRRYDPAVDRAEKAPGRLRRELFEVLLAAGADPETAEDTAIDVCDDTLFAAADAGDEDPEHAGRAAVRLMLAVLAEHLAALGVDPNPAAADTDTVITALDEAWEETAEVERPLLVARRHVRRVLDPEVPADISRAWIS